MADLEAPSDPDALYLARGDEVERLRPVLQGDVFEDAEIPGLPLETTLAVVLTHPCSMRTSGGALRERLAVARVREYRYVAPEDWPTGHYRVLPMPRLRPGHENQHLAADFEMLGTVASSDLLLDRRIACLSDYGIAVLQQRRVHNDTRLVVELEVLHEQAAPNLEEAELLHEWLEALVSDPQSDEEVTEQTAAFDAFLSANHDELREQLVEPISRAAVRRKVFAEISARKPAESD